MEKPPQGRELYGVDLFFRKFGLNRYWYSWTMDTVIKDKGKLFKDGGWNEYTSCLHVGFSTGAFK